MFAIARERDLGCVSVADKVQSISDTLITRFETIITRYYETMVNELSWADQMDLEDEIEQRMAEFERWQREEEDNLEMLIMMEELDEENDTEDVPPVAEESDTEEDGVTVFIGPVVPRTNLTEREERALKAWVHGARTQCRSRVLFHSRHVDIRSTQGPRELKKRPNKPDCRKGSKCVNKKCSFNHP